VELLSGFPLENISAGEIFRVVRCRTPFGIT